MLRDGGPSIDTRFLDEGQYAAPEIAKYEAIYGRGFVSPGGRDTAAALTARLGLRPGQHVLDAGCGLGGGAFLLAERDGVRVTGVDLSANMIAIARSRRAEHRLESRVRLVHGDCLDLDEEQAFNAVVSRDVFLHVHDKARLFAALHRALVPGGRLLVTDYCAAGRPWSGAFRNYVAERGYHLCTVADYARRLEAAGFETVAAEDCTGEFVRIHERELEQLARSGLPAADRDELATAWRAKIDRARAGEQRWGLFTARRPA